jgi:carbon-monoxide dehydrogenase small subunit
MLITAIELLRENPDPEEHEVREALSGNICRCTGYGRIIEAVRTVSAVRSAPRGADLTARTAEEGGAPE